MAQRVLNQKPPRTYNTGARKASNNLSRGTGAAMERDEWDLREERESYKTLLQVY